MNAPINAPVELEKFIAGFWGVDHDPVVLAQMMKSTMRHSFRLFLRGIQAIRIRLQEAENDSVVQRELIDLILWQTEVPLDPPTYPNAKAWYLDAITFTEELMNVVKQEQAAS